MMTLLLAKHAKYYRTTPVGAVTFAIELGGPFTRTWAYVSCPSYYLCLPAAGYVLCLDAKPCCQWRDTGTAYDILPDKLPGALAH